MATEIPIFQLATDEAISEVKALLEDIRPDIDATVAWGLAAETGTATAGAAAAEAAGSATAAESARAAAANAKTSAVAAKDAAIVAKEAAEAVPTTTAGLMDAVLADTNSAPAKRLTAAIGTTIADVRQHQTNKYRFDQYPIAMTDEVGINSRLAMQDGLTTLPNGDVLSVFWDERRYPQAALWSATRQTFQTYDLSLTPGNPLFAPSDLDDHNNITVARSGDGVIHVIGNHHVTPLRYVTSVAADNISAFKKGFMTAADEDKVTYPTFITLPSGDLLFLYRNGSSGNGDWFFNRYSATTHKWTRVSAPFSGRNADPALGQSLYFNRVVRDPSNGRIHVWYLWRDSEGGPAQNHDLGYVYSDDDAVTWKISSGANVTLPLMPTTTAPFFETGYSNTYNQNGASVDSNHVPHSVWRTLAPKNALRHFWYSGGTFHEEDIFSPATDVGRPAVISTTDGRTFAVYRSGQSHMLQQIAPTLETPFVFYAAPTGGDNSWEAVIDPVAAQNNILRVVIAPLTGTKRGTYGGILTVDLSVESLALLKAGLLSAAQPSSLPVRPTPNDYPIDGPTMTPTYWYGPKGTRLGTGAPVIAVNSWSAAAFTFAEAGVITRAAVNIVTAGDAGSTFEILFVDPITGVVLSTSAVGAATSTGNVEVLVPSLRVARGQKLWIGAIVRGGTTGVAFRSMSGSVSEASIGGLSANSVLTNTFPGVNRPGTTPAGVTLISPSSVGPGTQVPVVVIQAGDRVAADLIIPPPVPATLFADWNASSLTGVADGADVASLPNSSGTGSALTASAGALPAYVAAGIGTRPALRFATADAMASAAAALGTDFTLFVVQQWEGTGAVSEVVAAQDDAGTPLRQWQLQIKSNAQAAAIGFNSGAAAYTDTVASATTAPTILEVVRTPTTIEVLANGVSDGSTLVTGTAAAVTTAITVGSRKATATTFTGFYNGKVARVLLYTGVMTTAERLAKRQELAAFYGITL
jgi:hypothetical protein